MKYRIQIELDEDDVFVATCSSLPGCVSQGKTREESASNIKEAIEAYIISLKRHNEPIPPGISAQTLQLPGEPLQGITFKRKRAARRPPSSNNQSKPTSVGYATASPHQAPHSQR
jgi:antitoxin HicB